MAKTKTVLKSPVEVEKDDLDAKIAQLAQFVEGEDVEGEGFSGLHYLEQDKLRRQLDAMRVYSDILGERI